jgi:hypothetical protein
MEAVSSPEEISADWRRYSPSDSERSVDVAKMMFPPSRYTFFVTPPESRVRTPGTR